MFTVKLFKSCHQYDGATIKTSVSCDSYDVYDRNNGNITITCYKNHVGTDYHLRSDDIDSYESCFVENLAGKTIDRVFLPMPGIARPAIKSPSKQGKVTKKAARVAVKKVTAERLT